MRRSAAVAVAACLVPVLVAGPAHADGELGLSYDGRHWQDRLERPLFDPGLRWVPGDVRTARFYVRNLGSDRGSLTVEVEDTNRAGSGTLSASGHLRVVARAGRTAWTSMRGGDLAHLVDDDLLASGRTVPVEVRVSMDASAPNRTMVLSSDLDFRVVLRDARAAGAGSGAAGQELPATGTPVPPWLPPVALGLLGSGLWLVVRRRGERSEETR